MLKRLAAGALVCLMLSAVATAAEGEWKSLMDGKSFEGWKISENPDSWKIEDGAFVAKGDRSHLFYVGEDKPFKNFEFKAKVKTNENSNGGIYFHTKFQDTGWPKYGFEAQVNNTHKDPKKTGGIYSVKDVMNNSPAKDGEWFDYYIKVDGKHIVTKINGKVAADYTEPDDAQPGKDFTRVLDKGTFALQAHDPGSTVWFKDIQVRRLDD
ncbi:DUF1080 domain-containing protein [Blastopirellula marina]|uniref:DUF1080 domain-containing protein n=1 Tax=Blastopirellula marina TaxID=124 RepID=A0A2S8FEK4_9BACT|nr:MULTISPECIES: DUF1080 domain-containing protein [Pirellulaceae]PQO30598.1 DUF1080 domain-containing protein [Blastopirellula marina]RCS50735.1 DUF1080 domain-containing protein [Bremerella cremea]